MSIQKAIHFLRDIGEQPELRNRLYAVQGRDELFSVLAEIGYGFTGGEFEEAVDHVHVACQSAEEADNLMDKANWFRMVSANA